MVMRMVTEKQAEDFGFQMFWYGLGAGFLACIGLSLLLGWYS